MKLKQMIAGAAIGCTLGITGIGLGSGVASATPCMPAPGAQCGGPGGPGGPPPQRGPGGPPQGDRGPGGPGGPDFRGPDNHDWRPPWNPGDNDWRGRFHGAPWGNDLPPWGWGAPPAPPWDGPLPEAWGPPPPPINQWGFYFCGIGIPLLI